MHSWPHRTAVRTLCATTCSGRATFAAVTAAPCLLGDRPSCHPIRITCIAIVRQRGGLATTCCWWAALSMDLAAPSLFPNTPSCDPIGEAIRAIIRICWPHWQHWLDRQHWQHWHNNWGYGGHLRTALMVNPAAPSFLVWCPRRLSINSAIERVAGWHWTDRPRRRRRGWCWCGEWSRWHSDRECLRASCSRPRGATIASCGAAIVLLLH